MHRSGTSFLAGVLAGMGAAMGDRLLPPDAGNPRGYYEDEMVLAFHKQLLAARVEKRQTRADFLPGPDFDPGWTVAEATKARELVEKSRREGLWGWKEPRTCLFLAQWLEILPQARCVAVYRHPLEVYYSFLKRGDWSALFAPEAVFGACAAYNGAILAARQAHPESFLLLHAQEAFADPATLARRLARFLDLPKNPGNAGSFVREEFTLLPVSREKHALLAAAFPEAAEVYNRMQLAAEKPGVFTPETGPLADSGLLDALSSAARSGAGRELLDAFALPPKTGAAFRAKIAADVEKRIASLSGERDEYVANFNKYKALYENYFSAWQGTERTLAETRRWVDGDLLPKIERWRALLSSQGVPFEE